MTLDLASTASRDPAVSDFARDVLGSRPRRVDDPSLIGQAFKTRQPMVAAETEINRRTRTVTERYGDLAAPFHFHGLAYIPLVSEGESIGVIGVMRYQAGVHTGFGDDALELMYDIVELATPTVVHARLHDQLAEANALFETAFAAAPVAMAIHSAASSSQFVRANASFAALVGRAEAELIGTPVHAVIAQADQRRIEALLDRVASGELQASSTSLRLERGDGATITVRTTSRMVHMGSGLILTQVPAPLT